MPRINKYNQVDLQTRVNDLRIRSRQNLRYHTAAVVFFFTGIFLTRLIFAFFDFRHADFSWHSAPEWFAVAIATPMFVSADILAGKSLKSGGDEHRQNVRAGMAFALTVLGYAILIGVMEVVY